MAMLFAPFGCTNQPPPVLPFLLMQNLSPENIVVSDITKWKFHDSSNSVWQIIHRTGKSGLHSLLMGNSILVIFA